MLNSNWIEYFQFNFNKLYTSWYPSLLMVKTFSNTFEAIFVAIILHKWLKIKGDGKIIDINAMILTLFMTISFIMRSTSFIPWMIPMIYKVFVHKTFMKFIFWIFAVALPIMMFSVAWDSYFYGKLTFTAYNFFDFNVLSGQSKHFGVNSSFNYFFDLSDHSNDDFVSISCTWNSSILNTSLEKQVFSFIKHYIFTICSYIKFDWS